MDITNPIYGTIKLDEVQEQLIDTPEMQRMKHINQLALVYHVFPSANHTRFVHALGVSYTAGKIADQLRLSQAEKTIVEVAGLLHDIGHLPYSHTLDSLLNEGHETLTKQKIEGGNIEKILYKHRINPKTIGDLVTKNYHELNCLQQIIFSEIDADQLDYLQHDSFFTGVKAGVIDYYRIIDVMENVNGKICFKEKGINAIENMIAARRSMYKNVYMHRAVRAAEAMMVKAVEIYMKLNKASLDDFVNLTDGELVAKLQKSNEFTEELVNRVVTNRELYKIAYEVKSRELSAETKKIFAGIYKENPGNIEKELCKRCKLDEQHIVVEMPAFQLKRYDTRLKTLDISILMEDGSIKNIYELSPVAKTLGQEEYSNSALMIFCAKEKREAVGAAAKEYIDELVKKI